MHCCHSPFFPCLTRSFFCCTLQRKMKNFLVSFYFLLISIILLMALTPIPSAQLTTYESRILLQVQKLLEHPEALQGWTYHTNFCFLPPSSSLNIVCTNGHVTELTIIGNKNPLLSSHQRTKPVSWNSDETLSERFSIDSFFTVLSRLSHLKVLTLVSIGLWGPLPSKVSRFWSLEVLNISSNFIYGEIPPSISNLRKLTSLVLANNLFNGSVPDLTRLAFLEELNLGSNDLGPEFPSISKNLVRIVLRNNSLICQIPSQLMQLHKLQHFDVSSNGIFGNIPPFLFSLPFLQYLNLASNQFSGSLSQNITCGSVLTFVDISHNLLFGKLPSCISSRSSNRTMLYSWNCLSIQRLNDQYPPPYCKSVDALAVKPPVRSQKESQMNIGMVLGIFGVVIGIVVVVALLIMFVSRKYKAERSETNIDKSFADKFSALAYPRLNIDSRHASQITSLGAFGLPPYCTFRSEEIEEATSNFDPSNLIGEGSQGQLYKGRLIDGSVVLVNCVILNQKSLHKNSIQNLKKVLPNLRHRNLVSVLGHNVITYQDHPQTTSTICIVFEHFSKVTLKDHLADRRRKEILKWPQRMAIGIGIARGVQFLHTGVSPGIFGNNLKIDKILLDDSLNAKVCGYNIPLQSKKGLDRKHNEQSGPNHIESSNDAEKEDIYQLGVILLQAITGKLITSSSDVEELKNELERSLSEAASSTPRLTSIDPSLRGSYIYESLRTALQITINCLSKVASIRPSIEDVLWNLQYSMQVQEARSSSANSTPRL